MYEPSYALSPQSLLRSIDASRDTLGRARMKLIDVVSHLKVLTDGAPYAVIDGLAQILWARKTHTDDLDVTLAATDLARTVARIGQRRAPGWRFPKPPDLAHEENNIFEVYHLLFRGSVVDVLSFRNEEFTAEIIATAQVVHELRDIQFIRPELLLVTHLLRPGPAAALAAVELVLVRRDAGDFDLPYAEQWATRVGRLEGFRKTLARADELNTST